MSSRFFVASDSSSEESSEEELYSEEERSEEEESEEDSDEDEDESEDDSSDDDNKGANRFLKDEDSDDDSDEQEEAKVLKSAKDKRFEELEATVRSIENAEKINDWAVIQDRKCASWKYQMVLLILVGL